MDMKILSLGSGGLSIASVSGAPDCSEGEAESKQSHTNQDRQQRSQDGMSILYPSGP
jgi:hypothetical protein